MRVADVKAELKLSKDSIKQVQSKIASGQRLAKEVIQLLETTTQEVAKQITSSAELTERTKARQRVLVGDYAMLSSELDQVLLEQIKAARDLCTRKLMNLINSEDGCLKYADLCSGT